MKKHETFEGAVLCALSLMLVSVFALSVWMYDDLAENTESGMLAAAAASVRDFIDENEAVAVFLGIDEAEKGADTADIAAEAAAYIERYNKIYESLE